MSMLAVDTELPQGGFNFENVQRNLMLENKGFPSPKATKTGTTIAGIVFKDGIILGADTRATNGSIVADKNCEKIHYMAPNMYCCGAGTAADCHFTTAMISSQLAMLKMSQPPNQTCVPVITAERLLKQHLFRYQGHISAALVLGGVDDTGPRLCSIHPHGSTDTLPYTTMGSGSLAAMAVFESRWKPDMSLEEGKLLVRDAIAAGIFNDLGSGSNIDLCVIQKNPSPIGERIKVDYLRPYDVANTRGSRMGDYTFKKGTTAVLTTKVDLITVASEVRNVEEEQMETDN